MAKTIEQIQGLINDKHLDQRQLLNLITDFLEDNPPGAGGSGTLQDALDAGSVLNKNNTIVNPVNEIRLLGGDSTYALKVCYIVADPNGANLYAQDDGDEKDSAVNILPTLVTIQSFNNLSSDNLEMRITPTNATINKNNAGVKQIATVNLADDFANDAAAATGNIPVGGCYHTSGTVKIRLA